MSISEFVYTVLLSPRPLRRLINTLIQCFLPPTVRIGSAEIAINPRDPVVSGALTFGVYEREEIHFFQNHYQAGMTFLDVGANVGLYTALALAIGKNHGCIVSIEPHEESRSFLMETVRLNTKEMNDSPVIVIPVAVGNFTGRTVLHSNIENKGDNRIYADSLLSTSAEVEVTTIDTLCSKLSIGTIDFIKIDVQGAECVVLEGATSILDHSSNCILMTEFWSRGLESAGSKPEDYIKLMKILGFEIFELKRDRLRPVRDERLLSETSGRAYRNIVGLKGASKSILSY